MEDVRTLARTLGWRHRFGSWRPAEPTLALEAQLASVDALARIAGGTETKASAQATAVLELTLGGTASDIVRARCTAALGRSPGEAWDTLVAAARDRSAEVRRAATNALAEIWLAPDEARIETLADDGDPWAVEVLAAQVEGGRFAAAPAQEALQRLALTRPEAFFAAVDDLRTPASAARFAAPARRRERLLGCLADPRYAALAPFIEARLRSHDDPHLATLVWVAGRCGVTSSVPVIIEVLDDVAVADVAKRECVTALDALGAVDPLNRLALDAEANGELRDGAVRALGALGTRGDLRAAGTLEKLVVSDLGLGRAAALALAPLLGAAAPDEARTAVSLATGQGDAVAACLKENPADTDLREFVLDRLDWLPVDQAVQLAGPMVLDGVDPSHPAITRLVTLAREMAGRPDYEFADIEVGDQTVHPVRRVESREAARAEGRRLLRLLGVEVAT